jgi:hypothetical protein
MKILFLFVILLNVVVRGADDSIGVRIHPVWWQAPAQARQLYAEGKDGKPHPIRVLAMCPLESFVTTPLRGAVLLYRVEPDPADPKSKERWEPYVTAVLPSDSKDILMLLLPSANNTTCRSHLLPMDATALRWGGTRLVNFTSDPLAGQVDGKNFAVARGDSVILPFIATRRAVVDIILAADSKKGRKLVFSSKGIFTPTKRTILFIVEKPESGGYETRAIEEPNPDPKAYEDSESGR